MSTWLVNTGSPRLAERMAKPPGILADTWGWALPGEIRHPGDGVLWLDQVAVYSLRIRRIQDAGEPIQPRRCAAAPAANLLDTPSRSMMAVM